MPRRNPRLIESDTEEDINISSNSESEYTDTDNSENESEYSDTEDNIEKVIDNDISDEEFNKEENDSDINLLSNKLLNSSINENSLTNKPFDECYEELNKFFKENVYNYSPEKKDKKTKKIIQKAYYVKNDKIYYDISFKMNEDRSFSKYKDGVKDTYEVYLRCQYILRKDYSFLFINLSEYETFLILLNNVINNPNIKKSINYNKYKLDIIETYTLIVPLLIDIDYHYIDKYEGRRLYEEIIDIILKEIELLIRYHYNLDIYDNKLNIYVYSKDSISDNPKNNDKKDGFHIGIYIPIILTDYMSIHNELVERLSKYDIINEWFKKYDIKTPLDDFIDKHLKDRPYMMTGCTKYLIENNYKPSPVYNLDIKKCRCDNIENFKNYSVIKSSVAQFYLKNTEPLKLIKPFNNIKQDKEKNKKNNTSNRKSSIDLDTPTDRDDDYFKINNDYTIEEIEYLTTLIKSETIGSGKYENWRNLSWAIWSYTETYNTEEIKFRLRTIIHNLMKRGEGYNYNDQEKILNEYNTNKEKHTLGTLLHFAKKDNEVEYNKFQNERKRKREDINKEYRTDTNITREEEYNIDFEKVNFSNKIMSDLFLYKNVIEAIKYFYKFHIYDGSNIYRLQFTTENKTTIINFSNEIKKQSYKEDMNNIKELDEKEIDLINNTDEYGMQFIKDVITNKKIKTDKGTIFKKSIKLYDALSKTLQFNISIKSDDLLKDNLLYGINYYNKYDIIVKRVQYFNTSKIAKYFYFDDILSSNLNIDYNDDLIKPFIKYIDDVICTIKKDEEEKNEEYYNVIEQKKYYVYNYLKSIFNRKKNNTCLLLVAKKAGTGKTSFSKLINAVISNNLGCAIPGEDFLNDTYNGADIDDKLFISLEEVEVADTPQQRINISNKIKNLITNDTVRIRKIRQDPKNKENFVSYCITSNSYCPVIMDNEAMNRRFAVFDINNKQSDKFYNDFYNHLDNKEALTHFYNFIKNNEFHCHCNSPNCPEHSDKPFEQRDGIMTPEKKKLIYSCAISDEKFLTDFYYLWKYAIAKNKDFKHLDKDDNTKINITFTQLYIEYKNYCKFLEIKPHSKDFFSRYCDDGLLTHFRGSSRTERIYKTIDELRDWLFNKKYIGDFDDYNFDDEDEVFEYGEYIFGDKVIVFH
ncbi:MAG: hypothetical protein IIZ40_00445 [Bacilli bacterium]|nr:hypothetical protein [Bacilli bacterium]